MQATKLGMRICFSITLFLCVRQISLAQSPHSEPVKTVQVGLGMLGWQPPEPMHHGEFAIPGQLLTIDHQDRILVGYTVREREGLITREQSALSFHILRFTPASKVDLSLALPSNNWHSNGVYLDDADDIVARANGKLQLLLRTDEASETIHWQTLAACGPGCHIRQAFSRSTLLLFDYHTDPSVTILEGSPPHIVKCMQPTPERGSNFTLSASCIYFVTGGAWPEPPPVINRWPLCGSTSNSQIGMSSDYSLRVSPLNDEWLVINAGVGRQKPTSKLFSLVSSVGREKYRLNLPKHDFVEMVEGDERGDRFAVSIATWKGGSQWLDISGNRVARRIVVYESATGNEVGSFAVTPHALIELAMSPDGHCVAVLANDTVTIADLP